MEYSFSKLLGRMKEREKTQSQLAKAIGKNESTLSAKLNGKSFFTVEEIDAICRELDISSNEIGVYFFTK